MRSFLFVAGLFLSSLSAVSGQVEPPAVSHTSSALDGQPAIAFVRNDCDPRGSVTFNFLATDAAHGPNIPSGFHLIYGVTIHLLIGGVDTGLQCTTLASGSCPGSGISLSLSQAQTFSPGPPGPWTVSAVSHNFGPGTPPDVSTSFPAFFFDQPLRFRTWRCLW